MNFKQEDDFDDLFPALPDEVREFNASLPCKTIETKNYDKNRYLVVDASSDAEKIIEAESAEEAIATSGFSSIKKALQISDPTLQNEIS